MLKIVDFAECWAERMVRCNLGFSHGLRDSTTERTQIAQPVVFGAECGSTGDTCITDVVFLDPGLISACSCIFSLRDRSDHTNQVLKSQQSNDKLFATSLSTISISTGKIHPKPCKQASPNSTIMLK